MDVCWSWGYCNQFHWVFQLIGTIISFFLLLIAATPSHNIFDDHLLIPLPPPKQKKSIVLFVVSVKLDFYYQHINYQVKWMDLYSKSKSYRYGALHDCLWSYFTLTPASFQCLLIFVNCVWPVNALYDLKVCLSGYILFFIFHTHFWVMSHDSWDYHSSVRAYSIDLWQNNLKIGWSLLQLCSWFKLGYESDIPVYD